MLNVLLFEKARSEALSERESALLRQGFNVASCASYGDFLGHHPDDLDADGRPSFQPLMPFDLILVSADFEGALGPACVADLRRHPRYQAVFERTPIVVFSTDNHLEQEFRASGADQYVTIEGEQTFENSIGPALDALATSPRAEHTNGRGAFPCCPDGHLYRVGTLLKPVL